ncbi:MAG: hypothetical protein RI885_607 [Actinomycetota bacterium]|jgi:two-component system sensor histidine kinase MtrB
MPRLLRSWRVSLQFRTVAISVILSSLAVGVIGVYMSASIGDNLFSSRREQIDVEAARANLLAQQLFDGARATDGSTPIELETLGVSVRETVSSSTTSPGGTGIAILRTQGQQTTQVLQPTSSREFPTDVVTEEMRSIVGDEPETVHLQSVLLPDDTPGLVAGSSLTVPNAGQYELYLVYDLSDALATLQFVQRTLFIGGFFLVLLIGAVTYVVVRLVVAPVRLAAATSERLAAGELEVRIPEKGEDVIATLARSFNGMADSLQQQITKLAELSRLQQRFVSDVSHELRTPLTTIRLAGDVLYDQRASFTPAAGRTAELLHTQVERFEVLLSDLLEISRYDAGVVDLDLEPTNLVRLVEEAVEPLDALARERGSDLRVVAPGGYFEADVDARRIRRILRNLLGNAIEHGEGAPIAVTVDSNATAVAIAVRDYGVGMSQADVAKVFDRFWRADPSRQRTIGGTGLGLAISLEDTVLHDGLLDVWSEPGEGTCFRLTLPRERGVAITSSPIDLPPAEAVHELEAPDA